MPYETFRLSPEIPPCLDATLHDKLLCGVAGGIPEALVSALRRSEVLVGDYRACNGHLLAAQWRIYRASETMPVPDGTQIRAFMRDTRGVIVEVVWIGS